MSVVPWLRVRYNHQSDDLYPIYLAVSEKEPESSSDLWQPAYRDTVDRVRVVQIRSEIEKSQSVWLKDSEGIRKVKRYGA